MTDIEYFEPDQESIISTFIDREREQYDGEDNNLFTFALGQANRYYQFCKVIEKRFWNVSKAFLECHSSLHSHIMPGKVQMTADQHALFLRSGKLQELVQLEIESFYLFAKIMLDKVAQFIGQYFGQAEGCSLASHDRFLKSIIQYQKIKGLVLDERVILIAKNLKKQIADYRDKQISHQQNPRTIVGTAWSATADVRIFTTQLYPKSTDPGQIESAPLADLGKEIDEYLLCVFSLISNNRPKTKFKVKAKV